MSASTTVKATVSALFHGAGITSWKIKHFSIDAFPILMYHRVAPRAEVGFPIQAGMFVEPETFDLHVRSLIKYFEIVPLQALPIFTKFCASDSRRKHLCALTFDDGWSDFYAHAYPILKRHGVHATVYLPTDFIGTNRWFWTDRLGFLLGNIPDSRTFSGDHAFYSKHPVYRIACMPGGIEQRLEDAISLLKHCRMEEIDKCLSILASASGGNPTFSGRAFLTWEQVVEMAASGLVSFGSHTASHALLTTLTEEEAGLELANSMNILISQGFTDPKTISFSYPNGNFTGGLAAMVRNAGYMLAVTTQSGWNYPGEDAFTLKRISIHQDMTSTEAMFLARLANMI